MRNEKMRQLTLFGDDFNNVAAGTTDDITVYIRDKGDDILLATGTDVPADDTTGYAKGAMFIDTNVATGTGGMYLNKGTRTACVFTLVTQG